MAVTEEKLKDAVSKIESVSSAMTAHISAQNAINVRLTKDVDKNTDDIVKLQIDAERKNGVMERVEGKVDAIAAKLEGRQGLVLAWAGVLTPWLVILGGLVYFFIVNKGGSN